MNGSTVWVFDPAANFSTRLLPKSTKYTLPALSTASRAGWLRPVNASTLCPGVGPFDDRVTKYAAVPMAATVTAIIAAMTTIRRRPRGGPAAVVAASMRGGAGGY